jgi:hypothetical protein
VQIRSPASRHASIHRSAAYASQTEDPRTRNGGQCLVAEVFGPGLFVLEDDKVWSSGQQLLVLNPRPADRVRRGLHVTVEGIVTAFSRDRLVWESRRSKDGNAVP